MEHNPASGKRRPRKGGVTPFIACILLVITLWGLGLRLSPHGDVERAWKKTANALEKKEAALHFLIRSLRNGSLSAQNEALSLQYHAKSSQGLSLFFEEEGLSLGFYAEGDTVTLSSPEILEGAYSAPRQGAASNLSQSVFAEEPVSPEHRDLLRFLLALADPALEEGEALFPKLKRVWKKAEPIADHQVLAAKEPGDPSGTLYRYTVRSQGLVRALNELVRLGRDEGVQNTVAAYTALGKGIFGRDITPEEEEALRAFLSGKGEAFDSFSALVGKSDSTVELRLSVSGGYLFAARLVWKLGDYRGEALLDLSDEKGKPALSAFTLSVTKAGEEYISLDAVFSITDDSEMALIREARISLSDKSGILLPAEEQETSLTLRYSWGRAKGDLGLRIITPEEEINFRGALDTWKPGKRLEFRLKRIESEQRNLLKDGEISVSVTPGGEVEKAPAAKGPLFPEGDKKETLRLLLEAHYPGFFGGEAS